MFANLHPHGLGPLPAPLDVLPPTSPVRDFVSLLGPFHPIRAHNSVTPPPTISNVAAKVQLGMRSRRFGACRGLRIYLNIGVYLSIKTVIYGIFLMLFVNKLFYAQIQVPSGLARHFRASGHSSVQNPSVCIGVKIRQRAVQ